MRRSLVGIITLLSILTSVYAQSGPSLTTEAGPSCLGGRASTNATLFARAFDLSGAPVAGVSVTFDLTYPDGSVALKRGRSNQNGFAQAIFKFSQFGTYTLTVSATIDGVPLTASVTFDVADCS